MIDIIRGDWRYFWEKNVLQFAHFPSAWDSNLNTGIGIQATNTLWITSYLNLTAYLQLLGISWFWVGLFFWILPSVVVSFVSSFVLFRYFFKTPIIFPILAGLFYITNTYFLMILGGGQLGVAFGYAFLPLVLWGFIRVYKDPTFQRSLIAGLIVSAQILFDPRIFGITLGAFLLFILFNFSLTVRKIIFVFVIPFIVMTLLHLYWILPTILFPSKFVQIENLTTASVQFFSFAFFENTISLLHPNWPENIFGKVGFMRPEFLIIPIVAFSGLFFLSKQKVSVRRIVLYLASLSLLAAFFAKGTNPPFGAVYLFFFDYVPGFTLFRDPTKFYTLIAFAFSLLVPFSLFLISQKLKTFKKFKKRKISIFVIGVFLIFWFFSLRLILSSNVTIFRPRHVPVEYKELYSFITNQNRFFRTLWIPQVQRYGYFSNRNPAIWGTEFFKTSSGAAVLDSLKKEENRQELKRFGVKYVVVPYDSESEIFLEDRKYSEKKYQELLGKIESIPWLHKDKSFGKIVVFKTESFNRRIYLDGSSNSGQLRLKTHHPTHYTVNLKNVKDSKLIFSEAYNPYWELIIGKKHLATQNYHDLNSFKIPSGSYTAELFYKPQKFVKIGMFVSVITLAAIVLYLLHAKIKSRYS